MLTYKWYHASDELDNTAKSPWSNDLVIQKLFADGEVAESEQRDVFVVKFVSLQHSVSNVWIQSDTSVRCC